MDILWHCLVEDAECYDDALHWFLNQVRSKDQHAMGMETYKHLFLEKVATRTGRTAEHVAAEYRMRSLQNMSDIGNLCARLVSISGFSLPLEFLGIFGVLFFLKTIRVLQLIELIDAVGVNVGHHRKQKLMKHCT